tara:strand:+ start:2143 stop:3300 length:1158 start_codon:yes stop_codon:yes gene_type:complete
MGTKISALTETGSAPTGAYYPLEYDNANYKISTETLRDNLGGKYVADWAQSHGGEDVANGATLTITHNLGTADVLAMVYVNSSASDTNAQEVGMMVHNSAGQFDCGCLVTSLATNSIVVQLGEDGYNDITSGGGLSTTSFSSPTKYIKVVVLSAGTGLGGRYVADWAQSHGGVAVANTATLPITHNLGTANVIVQVFVNSSASDTNAQTLLNGVQSGTASVYGAVVTNITATEVTLQLGYAGYIDVSSGGGATQISFSTGPAFIKVVVLAAGASGGGANKYVADWATSHGGTTVDDEATLAISHDLGTTDFNVSYYVNDAATDTNAQIVTWDAYPSVSAGAQTTDVSTTGVTTQLGKNGYVHATSAGQTDFSGWAGKYLKAVFIG